MDSDTQTQNYQRIANAIDYLITNRLEQPSLSELSTHLNLSESYLQKLFSQWAGVSPKQFLAYLTKEHAKTLLRTSSVQEAALNSGLSGSGRLHDLLISHEGMTPGEYKTHGDGINIDYGFHPSPFGSCLIASTPRGICKLAFFDNQTEKEQLLNELKTDWFLAKLREKPATTEKFVKKIFSFNQNKVRQQTKLHLLLKGSPFQLQVWEALLNIPTGHLSSYGKIAENIEKPSAVRAVSTAIARNHIAFLIPCHRVIRSNGEYNHYRWGSSRKRALIAFESAKGNR